MGYVRPRRQKGRSRVGHKSASSVKQSHSRNKDAQTTYTSGSTNLPLVRTYDEQRLIKRTPAGANDRAQRSAVDEEEAVSKKRGRTKKLGESETGKALIHGRASLHNEPLTSPLSAPLFPTLLLSYDRRGAEIAYPGGLLPRAAPRPPSLCKTASAMAHGQKKAPAQNFTQVKFCDRHCSKHPPPATRASFLCSTPGSQAA